MKPRFGPSSKWDKPHGFFNLATAQHLVDGSCSRFCYFWRSDLAKDPSEFDELLRITLHIYYCLNLYSMYIYIYVYTLYICIPHICVQVDVVMKGLLPPFNSNLLNPQGLILLIQMAP